MKKKKLTSVTGRLKAFQFAELDAYRARLGYVSIASMLRRLVALDVRTESVISKQKTDPNASFWTRHTPTVDVQLWLNEQDFAAVSQRMKYLGFKSFGRYSCSLIDAELEFWFLENLPENRHIVTRNANTVSVKMPDIKNLSS